MKTVKIDLLVPYEKNTRTHSDEQIDQIVASITEFGWTNPILIDGNNGIIAGHGRVLAARKMGITEVPAIDLSHLNDEQKRAYIIADNQLALNAGWDKDMLAAEIASLQAAGFNLDLLGFSTSDLDSLIAEIEPGLGLTDPDDVPDVPDASISKLGDVWLLGRHRLMCGDALDKSAVEKLMQDCCADMMFTDPPYLMDFTGAIGGDGSTKSKHGKIINDKMSKADGEKFLQAIASMIKSQCCGAWYVCFYRLGIDGMMNALTVSGLKWRNLIIWKKNQLNLSNSDYKALYEPIVYGWQGDYEPILYGWNSDHDFNGKKGEVDVWEFGIPSDWEIAKSRKCDLHPTMKPVSLVERAIRNSSKKGALVLDLFGGSGTTLIACETTGRTARLMELEPKYCDVIITRWQEFTGKKAVLESNHTEFVA